MSVILVSLLLHSSGQWLRNVVRLPITQGKGINPAQATGAAISYARRYALSALLSIATGDDTDGAVGPKTGPAPQRRAPKATPVVQTVPSGAAGIVTKWADADRKRFCADVTRLGWKYEDVAGFCESVGKPRPSNMTGKQRSDLYAWLKDGPTALLDYIESKVAQ
jgi:hypothetical protein